MTNDTRAGMYSSWKYIDMAVGPGNNTVLYRLGSRSVSVSGVRGATPNTKDSLFRGFGFFYHSQ